MLNEKISKWADSPEMGEKAKLEKLQTDKEEELEAKKFEEEMGINYGDGLE